MKRGQGGGALYRALREDIQNNKAHKNRARGKEQT